jgi:hypothetical protein
MELPQRRQQLILAQLRKTGAAYISDLTGRFGISAATARRDLDVLADRGAARRVHGGAVLVRTAPSTPVHAPNVVAESAPAPPWTDADAPTADVVGAEPVASRGCDADAHFKAAQRLATRAESLLRENDGVLAEAYRQLADLHLRLALFARSR